MSEPIDSPATPPTDHVPTKPGWWYLRMHFNRIVIIEVTYDINLNLIVYWGKPIPIADVSGTWLGPVPTPAEVLAMQKERAEMVEVLKRARWEFGNLNGRVSRETWCGLFEINDAIDKVLAKHTNHSPSTGVQS